MDEGDFLVLYRDVVQRASELARQHSDLADHPLSACPDWTGRQLLAHLMGVAQDLVAGRVDGYASHVWTSAEVARGEGLPLEGLLAAWDEAAAAVGGVPPVAGVPTAVLAFGDAVVHEADPRAVLEPGSRVPSDGVTLAIKTGIARWRPVLAEAALPPLRIRVPWVRE